MSPKSYSQYKYEDVANLGISIQLQHLFSETKEIEATALLKNILEANSDQALSTEKAKSEFIIAPILFEIARKNKNSISFFSGHNLDVDKSLGLKGFCDFLFTKYPKSPVIKDPIFCIAEAKNDNLERGVPQCIAEMYAARIFNERQNKPTPVIFGCITNGFLWNFIKLENQTVEQDLTIYTLKDLPKILGILQEIVES